MTRLILKFLRVDLTTQSYELEKLAEDILERTLGGKGLAIHCENLHKRVGPSIKRRCRG